jgi:hypothetical protein
MKIYSAQLKGTTTVATGSNVSLTGSFSGSIAGIDINATNQFTASTSTRLTNIEIISASNINRITSLETKSASVDISISNINAVTASNIARLSNLETKSSSVDISVTNINSFTASNGNTSLNLLTGSLATTGSNSFFGTQVFSGSVYIANDLIVQGSSSIQYISASSVSIGTNIVQLNTANPSVRFAGLTIIDSGSIGGSGSFLYDSVHDEFVFVHRGNGTNVTSSHFVLGPETYDSLGSETYLTTNILTKGTGKEHLVDSCIFDNGTTTCIKNNLIGTGTACFAGTTIIGGNLCVGNTSTTSSITITGNSVGGFTAGYIGWGVCNQVTPGLYINSPGTNIEITTGFNERVTLSTGIGLQVYTNNGAGTYASRMLLDRSGNACFSGNVCASAFVGGTVDGTIFNSTSNAFRFSGNNALSLVSLNSQNVVKINAAGYWGTQLVGANDKGILIDNNGNVGIGATTPNGLLHICGAGTGVMLRIQNTTTVSGDQGPLIQFMSANQVGNQNFETGYIQSVWTAEGNAFGMRFATKGVDTSQSEKMRITSGGNIGINFPTPSFPLTRSGMTMKAATNDGAEFVMLSCADTGFIGGALVRNACDFGVINRTNGNLIFATNAQERLYITGAGIACFSCTICSGGSIVRKGFDAHTSGQWYKIPFYLEKGNGVGNSDTRCIVVINNNDSFQELHFTIEYGSRLQGVSDQATQTSLRSYGVNRFNLGTITVNDAYLITGGSGCAINTHAPVTVAAVGSCMSVVKVDFSSSLGNSSFVWGEIRIWSIESLTGKISIPNNNY